MWVFPGYFAIYVVTPKVTIQLCGGAHVMQVVKHCGVSDFFILIVLFLGEDVMGLRELNVSLTSDKRTSPREL